MRQNKSLPMESNFKEFSENKSSGTNKPGFKKNFKKMEGNFSRDRGNFSRDNRKHSFAGNREMFDAVCSKCKKKCKVPFKPTTGKPVSCSDCFVRKEPSNRRGGFQSRGPSRGNFSRDNRKHSFAGNREMFDAVCSKCKKKCKVPFKPTTGKPVSCSDCFVKRDSSGRNNSRGNFNGGQKSFGNNRSFNRGRR